MALKVGLALGLSASQLLSGMQIISLIRRGTERSGPFSAIYTGGARGGREREHVTDSIAS